jgi:hypothetical protein
VLVPANTPAAQLCEEENRMIWRGAKYPEVRAFRRGGEHADRQLRLA